MSEIRELIEQAKDGEIEYEESDSSFEKDIPVPESLEDDGEEEASASSEEISDSDENDKEASVGEQEGEAEEVEVLEPINPPVSWPAEDKERFSELPRELQQRIAERESQRDRAFHSNRQRYSAFDRTVGEHKEFIEKVYGDESTAVQTALAWLRQANENPIDTIRELMHVRQIDPRLIVASAQHGIPQDPQARQMALELQHLKARELQREREEQQRLQEQQEAQLAQLDKEVEDFSNARDETGKLAHPHIGELMDDMGVLIPHLMQQMPQATNQQVLEEAYVRALRANPKTFAKYEKQLEQQKTRELERRAKKAGAARKGVSGSLGSTSSSVPGKASIREYIDLARQGRLS